MGTNKKMTIVNIRQDSLQRGTIKSNIKTTRNPIITIEA